MTRLIQIIVYAFIVCGLAASGYAKQKRSFSPDWSLSVQLGGRYVNNVIRLSEADIDRFQHNAQPFETPIETYDDWKNELILRPKLRLRLPKRHRLISVYSFKAAQYASNNFLDYQTHTLNLYLRPISSRHRWLINLRAFTIPSYYLRNHYDRDTGVYHAARFQSWQYRAAPRFRFWKPLWIELRYGFETTYYNSKFTEYDGEMNSVGIGTEYRGLRPLTFTFRYQRNASDNIGHEQADEYASSPSEFLEKDAEYGDASFDEDEFYAKVSGRITSFASVPITGSLSGRLRRRVYTTDNSLDVDPFHRGRLDTRWKISPSVTATFNKKIALIISFSHEERKTLSDIARVEEIKNFRVREMSLMFEYRFN